MKDCASTGKAKQRIKERELRRGSERAKGQLRKEKEDQREIKHFTNYWRLKIKFRMRKTKQRGIARARYERRDFH